MAKSVEIPDGQESFKLNEVCKLANVQPYMLRFWGTEFEQLEARKSGTGQRLYDRAQVELILEVRRLLFDEGLTIAGARKKINSMLEDGERPKPAAKPASAAKRRAAAAATGADETDGEAAAPATTKALEPVEVATAAASDRAAGPLIAVLREVRSEVADILAALR